jgi:hypothetical protein
LFFTGLTIFYHDITGLIIAFSVLGLLQTVYSVWFYYQYFSVFGYTRTGLVLRSVFVIVSVAVLMMFVGIIAGFLKGMR